ncbi:hypothetical protein QR685DRAFT_28305 [Neurospora intermedia]|uniref:Uncharacterized protein n=1 Tax=Neurospora intermedia TaxID=5142 RepID=A0ABR3DQJ3_NEUIN
MTPGVLKFIEALASTGNEWPGLAAPLAGKKSGRTSNFAATRPGLPGQDHTKRHGRGGAGFKVLASTSTSLTQQGPLVPLVIRGKENGGRTSILVICALNPPLLLWTTNVPSSHLPLQFFLLATGSETEHEASPTGMTMCDFRMRSGCTHKAPPDWPQCRPSRPLNQQYLAGKYRHFCLLQVNFPLSNDLLRKVLIALRESYEIGTCR